MFSMKDIKKSEGIQFVIGLLIMFFALFLIFAFISYFSTGNEDQSLNEAHDSWTSINHSTCKNSMGFLGNAAADYFINRCFGITAFFIPLMLIFIALRLWHTYKVSLWRKFVNFAFLMIWGSVALDCFMRGSIRENFFFLPGGGHGKFICNYLESWVGTTGLIMVLIVMAIIYLIYLSHRTIVIIRKFVQGEYFMKIRSCWRKYFPKVDNALEKDSAFVSQEQELVEVHEDESPNVIELFNNDSNAISLPHSELNNLESENLPAKTAAENEQPSTAEPSFEIEQAKEEDKAQGLVALEGEYDPRRELSKYQFPPLSLLKVYENQNTVDMLEQNTNKERIIRILQNFGVEISSIKATVGPTITLYEITPAQGVRIAKIRNLEDDIALSLSALGIRIIAPIPGKGTIGIEVPNRKAQIVSAENIFNSRKFQECDYTLPIALGKTITNDIYMVDLAKMPHLLVAGATGMGKSVGLNIIIASLLYKMHPSEFKLVLIDPKKVEFSLYAALDKFFIAKVDDGSDDIIITDVNKVKKTLNSLCKEMDDRYDLLKKAQVRNIKEYNEKFRNRSLNPEHGHRFLPYIVVIIDEFGDLIMTAGKEIELPIARIAQLARAIGIHMVIATQRPTTNIITGTIKTNFPARMAFRVAAMIDSRTILDRPGANQLIGKGDMLFLAGGNNPERVQCGFIDTPEVENITKFISEQELFPTPYLLPDVAESGDGEGGGSGDLSNGNLDALFEDVARYVVSSQSGSTSLIQRKYAIGYNRAGRLMDQLECAGIVGQSMGSKPREVLIQDEMSLQQILDNLK